MSTEPIEATRSKRLRPALKLEGGLFLGGTIFFLVVTVAYGLVARDPFGMTALAFLSLLALLIGYYLIYTGRRVGIRPEDRLDAEIEEADPDYGFFSPHSGWPIFIGFSTMVIAFGWVFAMWMMIFGVFLLMAAVVGLVFEYYRGDQNTQV